MRAQDWICLNGRTQHEERACIRFDFILLVSMGYIQITHLGSYFLTSQVVVILLAREASLNDSLVDV